MKILHYSKIANEAWQKLKKEDQNILNRHFHLRPTNSGVTIVSTLDIAAMRGVRGITKSEKIVDKLQEILSKTNELYSSDDKIRKEIMKGIGFKHRQKDDKTPLE